jgi:hypothetical protein
MRRWIALSAKLYPRAWRQRYGLEFDALMEDVKPDRREFADVLRGAVKMQTKSETAYLKLAAAWRCWERLWQQGCPSACPIVTFRRPLCG